MVLDAFLVDILPRNTPISRIFQRYNGDDDGSRHVSTCWTNIPFRTLAAYFATHIRFHKDSWIRPLTVDPVYIDNGAKGIVIVCARKVHWIRVGKVGWGHRLYSCSSGIDQARP